MQEMQKADARVVFSASHLNAVFSTDSIQKSADSSLACLHTYVLATGAAGVGSCDVPHEAGTQHTRVLY
jgi:hypothetical protein